ncbi:M28 family peptidase [Bryobacter aggregatus]|uniref:M28 family peptidase n=1 Tax=Bryobacter aggregatus TaxID=360054 RepID=UPI0004E16A2F|nr:M28 family peptidase [Bryobacter aggregatus]
MRKLVAALLCSTLLPAQAPVPPIAGFTPDSAKRELELESKFDQAVNRQNFQQWLKRMSAKPHHVGSPASKATAEFIAEQFKSWGYETRIETFYPLFPTPKTRLLEMVAPTRYTAKIEEPAVEGDETSKIKDGSLPVYHAYSTDGDVTGDLVYVNYGLPDDYKRLAEMGIDVRGKIVLARYGGSWRGIKPKVAAENGAIGCLIYSDPRDDGYFQGDVYPQGPYRPAQGAQRGSVMDMPVYPGDPLTPGTAATDPNRKPDPKQASTVTKIPVMPISYGDAEPLLRALTGPVAPAEWRGALPLTYHVGPGPAKVHLKLEFDWKLAPTYNVVAMLKGATKPDQWVLRGNHHDGWNFGAHDPLSGMIAEMEEARVIGELAKSGWRPARTIVFLAWDGEEPALLGSTEWVEKHAEELREHAVAYINSDGTGRGFMGIAGASTMELFATQAARDVTDPQTQVSVLDRYLASRKVAGSEAEFRIAPLGSGSDYTAFQHHLGIPSLNIGFGGEGGGGVYHSAYDSYDHYTRFVDPDFQYVKATAQLGGRMMLRLANADWLPFRAEATSRAVRGWTNEVVRLADDMRSSTAKRNDLITSGAMKLAADPRKPYVAPAPEAAVPFLNFAPLLNATAHLERATVALGKVDPGKLSEAKRKSFEDSIRVAEQRFLNPGGLPRRPWFRHVLHAPGFYTGYGVKTLPGVREALEQRYWQEAETQIGLTATAINAYADWLEAAAKKATE